MNFIKSTPNDADGNKVKITEVYEFNGLSVALKSIDNLNGIITTICGSKINFKDAGKMKIKEMK